MRHPPLSPNEQLRATVAEAQQQIADFNGAIAQPRPGRRRGGETSSELSSVRRDTHQYVAGLPGVGKTHLAVGLGLKAIEAGYRVLFTTAAHMIAVLTKAVHESKLDDKLKVWLRMRLVSLIPFLSVRSAPDGSLP